jgi:hypothetical protein
MAQIDKVPSDGARAARDRVRRGNAAFGTWVANCIRKPVIAYLVVMTIAAFAWAVFAHHTDERLAKQDAKLEQQDYDACLGRNDILRQANDKTDRLVAVIRVLTNEAKQGPVEKLVVDIKPYKLTDCNKLRP